MANRADAQLRARYGKKPVSLDSKLVSITQKFGLDERGVSPRIWREMWGKARLPQDPKHNSPSSQSKSFTSAARFIDHAQSRSLSHAPLVSFGQVQEKAFPFDDSSLPLPTGLQKLTTLRPRRLAILTLRTRYRQAHPPPLASSAMRAKACTKCRQWKARCEYKEDDSGGCSRCRALRLPCVFDASFKRTSRAKSLQMMSSKIEQLQQALREKSPSNGSSSQTQEHNETLPLNNWSPQLPSIVGTITATEPPMDLPAILPAPSISSGGASTTAYRTLGNVSLTYGQINEHFKIYFARCHQYLPFKMTTHSPDAIYTKSPLLFWVICTTAASWRVRCQLAPSVKAMIADSIHSFPRSVEQVQALLIMSMWPFSVTSVMEDVSHYYCCLATQMALHLGLHRPTQTHLHEHGMEERENARAVGEEVKTTTWLSCFVVNQKLSAIRGLPPSILTDLHMLNAFDKSSINARLSQLCRIYHLLMQSNLAISANGSTPSGMLEPEQRLGAMKSWAERFSALERQHLENMDAVVKIPFLTSRLQLWSFALLDDMLVSPELIVFIDNARRDASELIEMCYSQNLSIVPSCVRNAMCFSAFVLIKILRSGYSSETEVLQDDIERVRQALSTTSGTPDDTHHKACETMRRLLYIEDKKLSPPIHTRMGASVVYDLLRIHAEDKYCNMPNHATTNPIIDLEGLDWNFLDMMG